jgi:hypothetical protein
MHDHHITQLDSRNDGRGCPNIPMQYVAVMYVRATIERNRQLGIVYGRLPEAAFLGLPLINLKEIYFGDRQPLVPFGISAIAQNAFNDDHCVFLN